MHQIHHRPLEFYPSGNTDGCDSFRRLRGSGDGKAPAWLQLVTIPTGAGRTVLLSDRSLAASFPCPGGICNMQHASFVNAPNRWHGSHIPSLSSFRALSRRGNSTMQHPGSRIPAGPISAEEVPQILTLCSARLRRAQNSET